ncbi:phosphatidylglycerophosphatase A [Methanococcus aeolicus]|uniref:phosphatidylglycerophosphatase A n=1 Tax=Methanococcus aeolicus TaxID=42879 RepID=UPI0021C7D28E|nr:phosphatidylglycerophosphatase A [Methanococcus aeolicus]UXM85066.1 phosphatidylglycerophosphatase A [Methanococcus aeolicus]
MGVGVIKLLSNYNISIDSIIDCGMELCICNEDEIENIRKKLERELLKNLSNPNLSTLIIASIKLEEEGKKGNLPFNYDEDPNYIYADEVIGMAIANEIAGTKAMFNFRWYDRKKPGIIGTLDKNGYVFLDDAIAGLIAGCMSKIFEC